ncbi:MAG TPA: hypothetical protein VGP72_08945 [Planctomycetota bacterium]|jgi:hypothetical protein
MHKIIKAALVVQLAEHYGLPEDFGQRITDAATAGEADKLQSIIDEWSASRSSRNMQPTLTKLRAAIVSLGRGLPFPEDCAGMVANYEKMTGKEFLKPAWLSAEMRRVE